MSNMPFDNAVVIDNLRNRLYRASGMDFDRRWKSWAKFIDEVDRSKSDGYAFVGAFVDDGPVQLDLSRPRLFLVASETGSQKYRGYTFRIVRLDTDGTASDTGIGTRGGGGWALKIRDRVIDLIREISSTDRLISVELPEGVERALREAAARRGVSVADLISSLLSSDSPS